MALAPLATSADLLARGVDVTDADLADRMLASASAAVREAAGAPISEVTSTVEVEAPQHGRRLLLPSQPVTAVTSVTIDGEAASDYRVVSGHLWRRTGWATPCGDPATVEVTFTHGWTEVPADIVELVCDLAIAGMSVAPEGAHVGLAYESIDDYRVGYLQGAEATASVWELPERTRLMLRRRFGGGAHVTDEAS